MLSEVPVLKHFSSPSTKFLITLPSRRRNITGFSLALSPIYLLACLTLFRSVRATLSVILPLTLVSILAYAMMAVLQIGLKTSTLPVAAFGVGIGVDYGIYIFSQLNNYLRNGEGLSSAYIKTLEANGTAVLVTGLTLSLSVITWIFSDLQFQIDMGILFAFMLLLNMVGAICVVPALAWLMYPENRH